jgi:hypothetical protein
LCVVCDKYVIRTYVLWSYKLEQLAPNGN